MAQPDLLRSRRRLPQLSPEAYARVTLAALGALAFIIVTGAAVRLTGSGLGCPDWPTCAEDRVVAPLEYHALVEFANRLVTGLVSVAVMLAVLGSLLRIPRRRDLTRWSLGLVAGVMGQVVLGGITVLFHLAPPIVMAHFLLSMVLLWNAVVLYDRATRPSGDPRIPMVPFGMVQCGRTLVAVAAIVVFTGTVVTATGPHGGDADVERLPLDLPSVARVHGLSVVVLVALAIATAVWLRRGGAPLRAQRRSRVFVGVLVAQAGVGYAQYFTGVPVVLVAIHIVGAIAVWVAVLRLHSSLFAAPAEVAPAAGPTVTTAQSPPLPRAPVVG